MTNANTSAPTSATVRDERGQGLVEYALIIALVSLAAVLALGFLSGKINNLFSKSGNVLNNLASGSTGGPGGGGAPCAPPCGWVGGSGPPANGSHVTGTFDNFWQDGTTIQHWTGSASGPAQAGLYDNNGGSGNSETSGSQHSNGEVRTYTMGGSSFTCRWHASSGIYAGWWYVSSPTPHPNLYPNSGTQTGQATFEWGCWPDGDMTGPTVTSVSTTNDDNDGQVENGETIVVVFSEALNLSTLCGGGGWSGGTLNNTADVTLNSNGSNDSITVDTAGGSGNNPCTGNNFDFGTLNLGGNYISSNDRTFGNSTISWNAGTNTLTITLGGSNGNGTINAVGSSTMTYTPDSGITDTSGNPISGNGTSSNAQWF